MLWLLKARAKYHFDLSWHYQTFTSTVCMRCSSSSPINFHNTPNWVERAGCKRLTFNKSHTPVKLQVVNLYKCFIRGVQGVQKTGTRFDTLSEIAESMFPPASLRRNRQPTEDHRNRTRWFIGAVAALGADTGMLSGEPITDTTCDAFSIFHLSQ